MTITLSASSRESSEVISIIPMGNSSSPPLQMRVPPPGVAQLLSAATVAEINGYLCLEVVMYAMYSTIQSAESFKGHGYGS